jgi:hypothetical protein
MDLLHFTSYGAAIVALFIARRSTMNPGLLALIIVAVVALIIWREIAWYN